MLSRRVFYFYFLQQNCYFSQIMETNLINIQIDQEKNIYININKQTFVSCKQDSKITDLKAVRNMH